MNGPNAVYTHEEAGLGAAQEHDHHHDHDHQPHRAARRPRTQDLEAGQDLVLARGPKDDRVPGADPGPRGPSPTHGPRTPPGGRGEAPVRQNAYTCPDFAADFRNTPLPDPDRNCGFESGRPRQTSRARPVNYENGCWHFLRTQVIASLG